MRVYGRDGVYVLRLEDWRKNSAEELKKLIKFLELRKYTYFAHYFVCIVSFAFLFKLFVFCFVLVAVVLSRSPRNYNVLPIPSNLHPTTLNCITELKMTKLIHSQPHTNLLIISIFGIDDRVTKVNEYNESEYDNEKNKGDGEKHNQKIYKAIISFR